MWADAVFARFGGPVYLVGPQLRDEPGPVSIRVVIAQTEFAARWPDGKGWAYEMGRFSKFGSLLLRGDLDFKVQGSIEAQRHSEKPRMRIDENQHDEAYVPPKRTTR
jgi:hypothetical protein